MTKRNSPPALLDKRASVPGPSGRDKSRQKEAVPFVRSKSVASEFGEHFDGGGPDRTAEPDPSQSFDGVSGGNMNNAPRDAHGQLDPDETVPNSTFKGYVDGLNQDWRLVGWVHSLLAGAEPLGVELLEGETVLDSAVANLYRADVLDAKFGDGHSGFSLTIPAALFDGLRHDFSVRVVGLPAPNIVGSVVAALPNRSRAKIRAGNKRTAAGMLRDVLSSRPIANDYDPQSEAEGLTRVLGAVARTYDHATALGLLYVHVLCRRIDSDGLQTRLTRLSKSEDEMARIVLEVLESDEARALYSAGAETRFPPIAALELSTQLRSAS